MKILFFVILFCAHQVSAADMFNNYKIGDEEAKQYYDIAMKQLWDLQFFDSVTSVDLECRRNELDVKFRENFDRAIEKATDPMDKIVIIKRKALALYEIKIGSKNSLDRNLHQAQDLLASALRLACEEEDNNNNQFLAHIFKEMLALNIKVNLKLGESKLALHSALWMLYLVETASGQLIDPADLQFDVLAHCALIEIYCSYGDLERARTLIDYAKKLDPNNPVVLRYKALFTILDGKDEDIVRLALLESFNSSKQRHDMKEIWQNIRLQFLVLLRERPMNFGTAVVENAYKYSIKLIEDMELDDSKKKILIEKLKSFVPEIIYDDRVLLVDQFFDYAPTVSTPSMRINDIHRQRVLKYLDLPKSK